MIIGSGQNERLESTFLVTFLAFRMCCSGFLRNLSSRLLLSYLGLSICLEEPHLLSTLPISLAMLALVFCCKYRIQSMSKSGFPSDSFLALGSFLVLFGNQLKLWQFYLSPNRIAFLPIVRAADCLRLSKPAIVPQFSLVSDCCLLKHFYFLEGARLIGA